INESSPVRSTILGTFLRGRPRNTSQSHTTSPAPLDHAREVSPSPPAQATSPVPMNNGRRRSTGPAGGMQPSTSATNSTSPALQGITHMLRRRRSAGTIVPVVPPAQPVQPSPSTPTMPAAASGNAIPGNSNPKSNAPTHRIRLVPHLDSRRSLRFDAISRDLREGDLPLRIGRFTDRSGMGAAAVNALNSNKLAFKSKVVSRAHAEVWADGGGKFYIRDTKSSSGTFLNHVRLSPANTESRPFQIKDGDILQLGVDYQGGTEDIYKSVKIRIEVGREWQASANAFNTNALRNLKSLAATVTPTKTVTGKTAPKSAIPDCCICLFAVTIRQALFIAPCSHTFHYKCIRPLLDAHHPAFTCPLCRTFSDLEEDVEVDMVDGLEADDEAGESSAGEDAPAAVVA
ncbi:SMAD/FHA domain-containing protein, partial [Fistulina hepatica ATCC 64428]